MVTGDRVMFVLVEGSNLPATVDDNTVYFVKTAKELYLGNTKIGDVKDLEFLGTGAGFHNSFYRGKNLGTSVTEAQFTAIRNGTFENLYIGDYWVIGNINWRIAAFDYYYNTGDTACTTHHVVIVPDSNLYTHKMNSSNTTTGGYVGSLMYTEGLESAKATIKTNFGEDHILTHRQYLVNAVTSGRPSAGAWYDSQVELMTEQNVYGGKIFGPIADGSAVFTNYTIDKTQYPLFKINHWNTQMKRSYFWLRDVVSAARFAHVYTSGFANRTSASFANGVRPAFSLIG